MTDTSQARRAEIAAYVQTHGCMDFAHQALADLLAELARLTAQVEELRAALMLETGWSYEDHAPRPGVGQKETEK